MLHQLPALYHPFLMDGQSAGFYIQVAPFQGNQLPLPQSLFQRQQENGQIAQFPGCIQICLDFPVSEHRRLYLPLRTVVKRPRRVLRHLALLHSSIQDTGQQTPDVPHRHFGQRPAGATISVGPALNQEPSHHTGSEFYQFTFSQAGDDVIAQHIPMGFVARPPNHRRIILLLPVLRPLPHCHNPNPLALRTCRNPITGSRASFNTFRCR